MSRDSSEEPSDVQRHLQEVMRVTKINDLLRLFISLFLFEICISNIRSRTATGREDYGYSYQFADGRMVHISDQLSLRNALLTHCDRLSNKFLPYLKESLNQRSIVSAVSHLSDGVVRVMLKNDVTVRKARVKTKSNYLNVIVGTKSKPSLRSQFSPSEDAIRIILDGDKRNVTFDFDCFESALGHTLHSLTKDWLEIAFAVYISDICVRRNPDLSRRLHILIPVRHLGTWSKVTTQLERTVSILARDNVRIHFVKKRGKCDPISLLESSPNENECVCLLSGGLDSAAGAAFILEKGLKPLFVSYSPGGILTTIQTGLLAGLAQEKDTTLRRLTVPWQARRTGAYGLVKQKDSLLYQHLRSFFYLSLATAAAVESRCSDVYICENGPTAINPLIAESHVNTRTVHPLFLDYYQTLVRSIFAIPITIRNPFLYKTKGQLSRYLVNRKLTSLIPLTNSCFYYYGIKPYAQQHFDIKDYAGKHDGDCLPCIIRRVSLHYANVPDGYDDYLTDVFNLFDSPVFRTLPDRSLQTLVRIADLLRFAQYLSNLHPHELITHFPDLFPYAQGIDYDKLTEMYRRYSKEILDCFRSKSSQELRHVFGAVLNPDVSHVSV
ncbi:hypothetical protein [Dehalococcoides mccartyi]|jgi:7-cyano-7-deazaguanine synthase in queuosine biosynthesis